ncbi:helix-turn-helix domain-containing protein [Enterococcus sp. DIV0876]|uniref:helix-turn-helix domain-containing protein n=1 Tax=Enterococcus sp. DIV0876 TaxID=2774633 RepID=UPI003D2FBC37
MLRSDFIESPNSQLNDLLLSLYHEGPASPHALSEKLKITMTTTNKYIKKLQKHLQDFFEKEDCALTITPQLVTFHLSHHISIAEVLNTFLLSSDKYQMMLTLFENGSISPKSEIAISLSPATYYRRISELNTILAEFSLAIHKGQLVGCEAQIVFFYFCFLWLSYEEKICLTKKNDPLTHELCSMLTHAFQLEMTVLDREKVAILVDIFHHRLSVKQGYTQEYLQKIRPTFALLRKQADYQLASDIANEQLIMVYDIFHSFILPYIQTPYQQVWLDANQDSTPLGRGCLLLSNSLFTATGYIPTEATRAVIAQHMIWFTASQYYFQGTFSEVDRWVANNFFCERKYFDAHDYQTVHHYLKKQKIRRYFSYDCQQIFWIANIAYCASLLVKNATIPPVKVGVLDPLNPLNGQINCQQLATFVDVDFPIRILPYTNETTFDCLIITSHFRKLEATFPAPDDLPIFRASGVLSKNEMLRIQVFLCDNFGQTSLVSNDH